jgi:hypothetical protein
MTTIAKTRNQFSTAKFITLVGYRFDPSDMASILSSKFGTNKRLIAVPVHTNPTNIRRTSIIEGF